jgi:hypothetical protein
MSAAPFQTRWQVDLGQEIAPRSPVLLERNAVVSLVTGLAWVELATGRVLHAEAGKLAVMALVPFGDGLAALRQDRGQALVDHFDAVGAHRWRAKVALGVARDGLICLPDHLIVIGSAADGLKAAFIDRQGQLADRWPLPTPDLRTHSGRVYGGAAMPVEGRTGVMQIEGTQLRWLTDAPAHRWALAGDTGFVETWDGRATQSELVAFSLDSGAERWRAPGGPNVDLMLAPAHLVHLETAAVGPVVVLRSLADGALAWRSAAVGTDEPGLFGRCSGTATLLPTDVVVWLQGRGLVRLAADDGSPRGEAAIPSMPPAGITPTPAGLLVRHDRQLSMLALA